MYLPTLFIPSVTNQSDKKLSTQTFADARTAHCRLTILEENSSITKHPLVSRSRIVYYFCEDTNFVTYSSQSKKDLKTFFQHSLHLFILNCANRIPIVSILYFILFIYFNLFFMSMNSIPLYAKLCKIAVYIAPLSAVSETEPDK